MADEIISRGELPDTMKWGLLCVDGEQRFLHLCTYEKKPERDQIDYLVQELKEDPEFEMQEMEWKKDYFMYLIEPEYFPSLLEELGITNVETD